MPEFVTDINPTHEQIIALDAIEKFKQKTIESPEDRFYLLEGGAGRGKTSIIKKSFIVPSRVDRSKFTVPSSIMGITLAHMARIVLSKSIPNSRSYASSVGMGMSLSPDNPLDIEFSEIKNFSFSHFDKVKYIVFDEASMVGYPEVRRLMPLINPDCKIIFLGDKRQLPRIGSPIDEDSPIFNIKNKFTLKVPVRQAEDSNIFNYSEQIGINIDSGNFEYPDLGANDLSGNDTVLNVSQDEAIEMFVHDYVRGCDVRMTSFRNATIDLLNKKIRNRLWGNRLDKFVEGDMLIGTNQYNPNRSARRPWEKPLFYNGQIMKVEWVKTGHAKYIYYNGISDNFLKSRLDEIIKEGFGFYKIKVSGVDKPITVLADEYRSKYNTVLSLLKEYGNRTGDETYWREFSSKFASVQYGYASTLYSIQGSTHESVYVHKSDVDECSALTPKRRLQSLYVGATRPTKKLVIF